MDKKTLEDYRLLEKRIESLERQISNARLKESGVEYGVAKGSNPEFPYEPRTFRVSGYNIRNDERRRNRIRALEEKLKKQKSEAEHKRLEVQEWIAGIEDTTVQLIFTYKYVDGMTHRQIGVKLHMEQSNVSKKIDGYLKLEPNSPKNLL